MCGKIKGILPWYKVNNLGLLKVVGKRIYSPNGGLMVIYHDRK